MSAEGVEQSDKASTDCGFYLVLEIEELLRQCEFILGDTGAIVTLKTSELLYELVRFGTPSVLDLLENLFGASDECDGERLTRASFAVGLLRPGLKYLNSSSSFCGSVARQLTHGNLKVYQRFIEHWFGYVSSRGMRVPSDELQLLDWHCGKLRIIERSLKYSQDWFSVSAFLGRSPAKTRSKPWRSHEKSAGPSAGGATSRCPSPLSGRPEVAAGESCTLALA